MRVIGVSTKNVALGLEVGGDLYGGGWFGRGTIGDDEAIAQCGGQALGAIDGFFNLRRSGDAEDDHVGGFGDFGGRGTFLGAQRNQAFHGRAVLVRHHIEGKALGQNVLANAMAHEANADEANVLDCHGVSLSAMK